MIAVDAMGGDYAPRAILVGVLAAAKQGVPVLLCGDEPLLISLLNDLSPEWRSYPIIIEHASQRISMSDEPVRSILKKEDSSLVKAAQAVAQGRASALVSAGNSGAVLAAGTLIVGRVEGVQRPAVGAFIPSAEGEVFCLDLGANTDCKADYLFQFAHMGHLYVSLTKKCEMPRVALLSNGQEAYKGSIEVKKAYELLEKDASLNFVGNIEGRDVFSGSVDVIVYDGFVGNIFLKTMQGAIKTFSEWIKKEASKSWWNSLLLFLNRRVFNVIKQKTDYARTGGALLLGVRAPVILAHGCSHGGALHNAILFAQRVVKENRVGRFNKALVDRFTLKQPYSSYPIPEKSPAALE